MRTFSTLAAALTVFTTATLCQVSFQIPVTFTNGNNVSRLLLGVNAGNTPGLDTAATFGRFREVPLPPMPPRPFLWSARFVSGTGKDSTFPAGLMTGSTVDFRGYSGSTQIDTFVVRLDGTNADNNPTVVSWPSGLQAHGTAWTIKPRSGRSWPATDMVASASVTIPPRGGNEVLIVKTGASGVNAVEPREDRPVGFELGQNYPNPFNPTTSIRFSVPATPGQVERGLETRVKLVIFDLLGREVARLADGPMPAGEHVVRFDASRSATGIYFYRLEAAGKTAVRKMMLVK
jgi:hypothetical protein